MKFRTIAVLLILLGLAQMGADAWGSRPLKALAAATAASPAPKVFGSVGGFETFSNRMTVVRDGERSRVDRAAYRRLKGPYNRRNVYGAALSYGPAMPRELRDPVLRRAFCGGSDRIGIEYAPIFGDGRAAAVVEVSCR
ncbi:MAG: hypothetical protein M0D55_01785 [Elusimicrobiota bacterium]|nr:MAG: hypothetical protein M0D55_01785 [Elusimicrobiota bacterium]